MRRFLTALGIAALSGTVAHAAALSNSQGIVSVNSGSGYVAASGGTAVGGGDRVKTGSGSSVDIVYDNGCVVTVGPEEVVLVLAEDPACSVGGTIGAGEVAVGVAIAGGVIGAAVAVSNSGDGAPSSP
ncbi:MAG: hypothetical protein NW216_00295 [Hyphomicrobium sp.]|nr:hypothetical protein [Hyphomicrobium sp.]